MNVTQAMRRLNLYCGKSLINDLVSAVFSSRLYCVIEDSIVIGRVIISDSTSHR